LKNAFTLYSILHTSDRYDVTEKRCRIHLVSGLPMCVHKKTLTFLQIPPPPPPSLHMSVLGRSATYSIHKILGLEDIVAPPERFMVILSSVPDYFPVTSGSFLGEGI
jgi:hypothetical protein